MELTGYPVVGRRRRSCRGLALQEPFLGYLSGLVAFWVLRILGG